MSGAAAAAISEPVTPQEAPAPEPQAEAEDPRARFRKFFAEGDEEPAKVDAQVDDKPPAEAKDKEAEKPEKKEEKPEADKKIELQLSNAQKAIQRLTTDNLGLKSRAEKAEGELGKLRTAFKGNPLKAMEEAYGKTFPEIMAMAGKGAFDANQDPLEQLPDDVRETVKWAQTKKQQEEQEAQTKAQQEARSSNLAVMSDYLAENEADLPYLDATAADYMLDMAQAEYNRTGQRPDLQKIANAMNEQALKMYTEDLTNEKLMDRLVAVPAIKAALLKRLGPDQPKPRDHQQKVATPAAPPAQNEVLVRTPRNQSADDDREEHLRGLRALRERA